MAGSADFQLPVDVSAGSSFDSGTVLKNRIFLLRHGKAESNVQGILVCNPRDGVPSYGLVEEGRQQAREAAKKLEAILTNTGCTGDLSEKVVIVSSDFKRTMETARIIHDHFKAKTPVQPDTGLRERDCGEFHLEPIKETIPLIIEQDVDEQSGGVVGGTGESFHEFETRALKVLRRVNEEYSDKILVLVSHVDPLQMFWALCNGVPLKKRFLSDLKYFHNCEIREFKFANVCQ